ncbi:MAG: ribonuclease Z [Proteobacteria bacterium]|nr:ribonuclease Z [Pseudomonadota bacterium]MBU1060790.1 ribonuclease Z [Pseudomonadota bacterium]
MILTFLGTGEACDPDRANTSLLLESDSSYYLFDCGFTVPHAFFHHCQDPEQLKTLWISHFHGDHFFGVPLLLLRLWEMGRKGALQIISGTPAAEKIWPALELAYPDFKARLQFPVHFTQLKAGEKFSSQDLLYRSAATIHSQPSFAVKIEKDNRSFYYSGDGRATAEGEELMKGCDLIVHEAFTLEERMENHGSVASCLRLQQKCGYSSMALVHLARETRRAEKALTKILSDTKGIHLATDGEQLIL